MNTQAPRVKIRLTSLLWPILAILLVGLQLAWPSRAWTTLLIILGGSWLLSFFWARSLARGIHLEREMRFGWAQVGDRLEQLFIATNLGWAPALWLEVEDHSDMPDFPGSRVTMVEGYDVTHWKIEGTCARRGLFTLGPTSWRTGDPLGIYSLEAHLSDSTVLLVLPPVLPLPSIEIASGGQAGEGRRHRRSALETTVSVDTVREYAPGDPFKSIHWPTSVRRQTLYVRQFEHAPSSDWWIFLDLEEGKQAGQGSDSTSEHGIILAASLAARGLRQGHAVGLVACGKELVWLPPQRHSGQLMDILRALAVVTTGERSMSDLLESSRRSLLRGASLVLISPDARAGWSEALLHMVKNEITPTAILLDPESFGGPEGPDQAGAFCDYYGISHTKVGKELLDHVEPAQDLQGKWEWRVVGHGKAVPVRKPKDMSWRRLG